MFTDLIMNFIKEQAVDQVSKKIGIDPSLLQGQGTQDAIGSLVTGLLHNAQKEDGLTSINNALNKDHDGSIFDDVTSLLTKGEEGSKIVEHILGNNQGAVAQILSQKLGITGEQASGLLTFIAPLVMGALGKKKQEIGATNTGVKKVLQQEEDIIAKKTTTPSIITALLDKDKDGDVDLADFLS